MSNLKRSVLPVILIAALIFIGCSSDDPAAPGGNPDNTPPDITEVRAVDQFHIDVEFNEAVQAASVEQPGNYLIYETAKALEAAAAAPLDTVWVDLALLDSDGQTVHLTTQNPMGNLPYFFSVYGVKDLAGNVSETPAMTNFTGSEEADMTPPTIHDHTPGAGETGVGIGQPVVVQFSEPMDYTSVLSAFSWMKDGTPVPHEVDSDNGNIFFFTALRPLDNNATYTVTIDGTAQDWAGNPLAETMWSFTTTGVVDETPPTLVSSTPSHNATRVAVGTNLVLTFSEAVEQNSLDAVLISPEIGDGIGVWSNSGRTVTFDPFEDMMEGTTYNLLIPPGGVKDQAGNGTAGAIQVVWSTGTSLDSGRFSGTISGPGSAAAANPEGAIVIAADRDLFGEDDEFGVGGMGTANAEGTYTVANLPDGIYWPACFLNTNGDGEIDPSLGDAVGAYGISFDPMSGESMSVNIVAGGSLENIDFEIYDPMAIAGNFSYEGTDYPGCCYQFYVGVFDTTGFQIEDPGDPIFGTDGNNWPGDTHWTISELDDGLPAGTYYVGAYLDGNGNHRGDPSDPMGFIGGMTPTPFTVEDGSDQLGLMITLYDVEPGIAPWSNVPGDRTAGDGKDHLRRLVRVFAETTNK